MIQDDKIDIQRNPLSSLHPRVIRVHSLYESIGYFLEFILLELILEDHASTEEECLKNEEKQKRSSDKEGHESSLGMDKWRLHRNIEERI